MRNVAIAAALGLVLALLSAFLREHFDRRLRSREAVEEHFGVPVIGQIPFDPASKRNKGARILATGAGAEAFRSLRVNLEYLEGPGLTAPFLEPRTALGHGEGPWLLELEDGTVALARRF